MPLTHGDAVERRVRHIAAILGVPEFVYGQPLVRKGNATREVGDGLLLCGSGGAILQVKARSRREGRGDAVADAERWVVKHVERAVRQGRGSKRTIAEYQERGAPLTAIPVRSMILPSNERSNFEVHLDEDCRRWPIIVVVDHPNNPSVALPTYEDAFCISLGDWHELNRHLRSVHELLCYVDRVLGHGSDVARPLGNEFERFSSLVAFEVANLDHSRARPRTSFAAIEDPIAISAYRTLIERTWGENGELPEFPASDYRAILDVLDNVPAGAQAHVGRWLLSKRAELATARHLVGGSTLLVDRPLIYIADSTENEPDRRLWLAKLWILTVVRAIEWREQMWTRPSVLGVGVRVIDNSLDEYSYVLVHPDIEIPLPIMRQTQWYFGVVNFSTFQTSPLKVGRNDSCPCGSERKYKRCHGAQAAKQ